MRHIFEDKGVFAPGMIDGILTSLRKFDPEEARQAKSDPAMMQRMVEKYFHS